ncbi:hypothetical protein U9M48_024542 [Paspalum notatum var. saurae]|uniref:Uncharacterized protein n=1 Tax=Paspalum notatum var. saurae TaxID=547442 RepID=A0AAQ3TT69_PASNO
MHIDPASELPTQEQPLIEEPDDQEQESQQQQESSLPTSDLTVETANPTDEGMEFLFCACVGGGPCHNQE